MPVLSLVIFDCDGVLFDSAAANIAYYNAVLARLGREPLSEEWSRRAHFLSSHQLYEAMFGAESALFLGGGFMGESEAAHGGGCRAHLGKYHTGLREYRRDGQHRKCVDQRQPRNRKWVRRKRWERGGKSQ